MSNATDRMVKAADRDGYENGKAWARANRDAEYRAITLRNQRDAAAEAELRSAATYHEAFARGIEEISAGDTITYADPTTAPAGTSVYRWIRGTDGEISRRRFGVVKGYVGESLTVAYLGGGSDSAPYRFKSWIIA